MTLVFFNLPWPLPNRKHAATTSYLTAVQDHLCSSRAYPEDGRDGKSVDGADRFENGSVGMHQVTKMSACPLMGVKPVAKLRVIC